MLSPELTLSKPVKLSFSLSFWRSSSFSRFDSMISLFSCYERLNKGTSPDFEMVPAFMAIYHGAVALFGSYALPDSITPWDPKTPYLKAIGDAANGYAYEEYLKQREVYGTSPAFYLDCAGWFFKAKETMLAIRILSNLSEMKLEDVGLWRTMGWRLREAGAYEEAIAVFRESGLIVEKSLLRERVSSFPSYTGVYDRGAKTALRASLEEADFSVYETLGGLSCRGATDTLTVNHDFTFSYSVDGGSRGTPSVLYADAKANGNLIGDSAERKALKEAAEDFFDRIGLTPPKRAQYAITLEDAYRDGNMILIRVCQTVRGRKTQNFSYLLYSADVVWAADGTFAPSAASEKTSAACVGLLDLLFSEKRYFDQQAKEGKPD